MFKNLYIPQILTISAIFCLASCDDDGQKSIRQRVEYTALTTDIAYTDNTFFVDADGQSTVDVEEGNVRLKMFKAMNDTLRNLISANQHIDAALLSNMFANESDRFKDATLNAYPVNLKATVASAQSSEEASEVRAQFEQDFDDIEEASLAFARESSAASAGVSGKLGNYLVDGDGIEFIQVIQKSFIGALQLDYIGNYLLEEGLTAENYKTVSDKNYTQLEHNWDVAYGLLTLNPIYASDWTVDAKGTVTEFAAGSYIWEYNKTDFPYVYEHFLKGRAAIVNNDREELNTHATFIRTAFEKAIANAALGYLDKFKTNGTTATGAHAFGEGLGFIYSLRFAEVHGCDAAFSNGLIEKLVSGTNGFWGAETTKVNEVIADIKTKFGIL